jgi:hypothetical protein
MSKKNLILGGIFIVLLSLVYFYQGPWQGIKERKGKMENFLAKIDAERIDKIEIKGLSGETLLEKTGDRWKIGGTKDFYAGKASIESAIKSLKEAGKADISLASERADKKADFKVDEENGTLVSLYREGNEVLKIVLGKPSNDYTGSYISRLDDDNTYIVKPNLSAFELGRWHDTAIFSSPKDDINKIRFQYPRNEFTLEKIDGQWKGVAPNAFDVDEKKILEVLNIMSSLNAADIPEQKFEGTGLEKNLIIVQASGEGVDNTLMVGNKFEGGDPEEDLFYAKPGNNDNIYLIHKHERDQLDKKIQDLR